MSEIVLKRPYVFILIVLIRPFVFCVVQYCIYIFIVYWYQYQYSMIATGKGKSRGRCQSGEHFSDPFCVCVGERPIRSLGSTISCCLWVVRLVQRTPDGTDDKKSLVEREI